MPNIVAGGLTEIFFNFHFKIIFEKYFKGDEISKINSPNSLKTQIYQALTVEIKKDYKYFKNFQEKPYDIIVEDLAKKFYVSKKYVERTLKGADSDESDKGVYMNLIQAPDGTYQPENKHGNDQYALEESFKEYEQILKKYR